MNYLELAKGIQEEISLRLKEWIKIPSVYDEVSKSKMAPFGEGVANALKYIASIAKQDGFEVDTCDGYCTEITYGKGDPMVLILGHADVVPAGRGWEHAPFDPVEKEGKIYGRGTSDDKGPTLAAYHALKLIKELNVPLKRKIRLVVGGNEESGSRCLDYYFATLKKPHGEYGFSPDADFPLIYAEKGIMNFVYHGVIADEYVESFEAGVASNSVPEYAKVVLTKEVDVKEALDNFTKQNKVTYHTFVENGKTVIEINGKAAHGGSPQQGINAASALISFIAEQFDSPLFTYFAPKVKHYDGSGLGIAYQEEEMGPVSVNLGIFNYKNREYNMILNIRYPKSMASKKIIKQLQSHILHDGKEYGNSEPLYVSPDSQLVKTLLKAYQEVSGDHQSKPYTISGGTYARHTTNSVAFGMAFPGEDNLIHQHDEYVVIESLVQGTAIYLKALIELANI